MPPPRILKLKTTKYIKLLVYCTTLRGPQRKQPCYWGPPQLTYTAASLPYNYQNLSTRLIPTLFNSMYRGRWVVKYTYLIWFDLIWFILFLCYNNDLYRITDLFTLMFADDTFSLKSDNDINQLIGMVNVEINKMAVWFRANKLAVNKNKGKYMIFRTKGKNWSQTFRI